MVATEELDCLSDQHIRQLRKEAMFRKNTRALKGVSFRVDTEEEQEIAIEKLVSILENDELGEVRGISIDDRKLVFQTAEEIAEIIGEERTVFLLNVKGHSALYYSPNGSYPLRTSRKGNNWTKRPRAERDNSGQIIRRS